MMTEFFSPSDYIHQFKFRNHHELKQDNNKENQTCISYFKTGEKTKVKIFKAAKERQFTSKGIIANVTLKRVEGRRQWSYAFDVLKESNYQPGFYERKIKPVKIDPKSVTSGPVRNGKGCS